VAKEEEEAKEEKEEEEEQQAGKKRGIRHIDPSKVLLALPYSLPCSCARAHTHTHRNLRKVATVLVAVRHLWRAVSPLLVT
jgi:hypothetical protein